MTREEFIETHYYELVGVVLDAAVEGRKGAELALWVRTKMQAVRARLGAIYDQLGGPAREPVAAAARVTQPPRK